MAAGSPTSVGALKGTGMRKAVAAAAVVLATIVPSMRTMAWASGGGGGATTSTPTTPAAPASGGAATGGGGAATACVPSLTVTATPSAIAGQRALTAAYATACASKTRVSIVAVNTATGATEWVAPSDSLVSSFSWNAPLFATTYRIDAKLYSSTGALLTSASTTTTTLPAPSDCGPFLNVNAASGPDAATFGLTASYSLAWCGGPTTVILSATNVATGAVEWSQYATATTALTWATPRFSTTYRVEATAYDGAAVLARSTATVTTIAPPPNCATLTNQNLSVGYWGIYAAVWVSTTARDCGYGMTSVHLRITNLRSGLVEYDRYGLPLVSLVDFEGAVVKYDTPYQVEVEVRGAGNEVLDSSSRLITTSPLR